MSCEMKDRRPGPRESSDKIGDEGLQTSESCPSVERAV